MPPYQLLNDWGQEGAVAESDFERKAFFAIGDIHKQAQSYQSPLSAGSKSTRRVRPWVGVTRVPITVTLSRIDALAHDSVALPSLVALVLIPLASMGDSLKWKEANAPVGRMEG